VDEGLGRQPRGRSRSRNGGRQPAGRGKARARLVVDPDYLFVPPQPIELPTKFTRYAEGEGRKGIRKRRGKPAKGRRWSIVRDGHCSSWLDRHHVASRSCRGLVAWRSIRHAPLAIADKKSQYVVAKESCSQNKGESCHTLWPSVRSFFSVTCVRNSSSVLAVMNWTVGWMIEWIINFNYQLALSIICWT